MPPISVFICYKKKLAGERPNEKADILRFILSQDKTSFDPWIDDTGLSAGLEWETAIYRRILVSDVLLVLVGPGTSESEWVKREIALATALGITIVPLGFDLTRDGMDKELKDLDIAHIQYKLTQNIKLNDQAQAALLSELRADLQSASARTKESQKDTLSSLLARMNPKTPKAADKQKAATFTISAGGRSVALYIASGDLSKVRDIDVLVNSENDYMQMARFFESRTVSSILRRRGARVVRDGKYEDTIQRELDWQLRDRGRPVHVAEVFVTSTGGQGSELTKINKARYIFHVAAVQAVDAAGTVIPFKQPDQIEKCVRASLATLSDLNQVKGVVSPPDTDQRKEQESRAEQGQGISRSILFPLFGTGQGGSTAAEVIGPMLAGITGYFNDEDDGRLAAVINEIYLSVFKQEDFDEVFGILRRELSVV
ncbi:MAG: hypothetical protein C5B57_06500 [Blastocatellia bacterium]|nr:MAG: hypothetical protein C5B57_06500 [Blastocatellia bacterium]